MLSSRIVRRFKGPCFSLFRRKLRFVIPTVDPKSLTLRCRPKLPELAMAAAESFLDLLGLGAFGACRGPSERRRCRAYRGRRLMAFRLEPKANPSRRTTCGRAGQGASRSPLKPRGFGEVHLEPVAFALVAAGHFGAGVAEGVLHMRLFDLGRRGQTGAQRMAGEGEPAFSLGQIAAQPGGERACLHQADDM